MYKIIVLKKSYQGKVKSFWWKWFMLARHVSSCHDTFSLSLTNVPHNHNMFHVLTGSWALPQLAILLQHPQELLASHVQQHHYGWQPETCSLLFCLLTLHCIAVLYGGSFKAGYFSWLIVITHLWMTAPYHGRVKERTCELADCQCGSHFNSILNSYGI